MQNDQIPEKTTVAGKEVSPPMTPMQAIRLYCQDCSETAPELRDCPVKDCPLWAFRQGVNPYRIGQPRTEKQVAAAERLGRLAKERGELPPAKLPEVTVAG